jgi:hypothetical protein
VTLIVFFELVEPGISGHQLLSYFLILLLQLHIFLLQLISCDLCILSVIFLLVD